MFVILDSQTHNNMREKGEKEIERTIAAAGNTSALCWRRWHLDSKRRQPLVCLLAHIATDTAPLLLPSSESLTDIALFSHVVMPPIKQISISVS